MRSWENQSPNLEDRIARVSSGGLGCTFPNCQQGTPGDSWSFHSAKEDQRKGTVPRSHSKPGPGQLEI